MGGALVVELGEVMTILELHRQGLGISAIAARLKLDRKTVRKYLEEGIQVPRYGPRAPRAGLIEPFAKDLTERVVDFSGKKPPSEERIYPRDFYTLGRG